MRKIFIVLGCVAMIAISCQKEVGINKEATDPVAQSRPTCGVNEAIARLSPEMRESMSTTSESIQANELLLYLDFDGAVVSRGFPDPTGTRSPIISGFAANCPAPALTAEQKQVLVDLVKDDFSPFNIVVTTDQAAFDNYPIHQNKQICIITSTPSVIGHGSGVGGVSPFLGPGIRLPYNPCFVFANVYGGDLAEIASTIGHEVGHTMGLHHQSKFNEDCGYITEYHSGFGFGPISFFPIMGVDSLISRGGVSNWWAQSCQSPAYGVPQDDFELLNSQVVLKADDFPDIPSGNNTITEGPIHGILEKQNDVDFIRINFQGPGMVTITSKNIDIKASLVTAGGHVLSEYNDPENLHVTIPQAGGLRFLKIEGASNVNLQAQYMTGKYHVSF